MQSSANSWRDALRSAAALQGFRDLTKGEKSFDHSRRFSRLSLSEEEAVYERRLDKKAGVRSQKMSQNLGQS